MTHRDELAWLAADVELRQADLMSGLVPSDVTRALFPWEVHTDFAGIEQDVDQIAAALARQMEADRTAFVALLDADLAATANNPGQLPVNVAVASRLLSLDTAQGVMAVAGAGALMQQAEQRYRDILAGATVAGGQRALDEAATQGVDVSSSSVKLGGLDEYRLDLAAQRLAQAPLADVLSAAAEAAYRIPDSGMLRPLIIEQLHQLSPQPLLSTLARPAVQQADTLGRMAAMTQVPRAQRYYASELLDKATCQPCHAIDGTQYDTIEDARVDYPAGGFKDCLGGSRCRGTVVGVWSEVPFGGG